MQVPVLVVVVVDIEAMVVILNKDELIGAIVLINLFNTVFIIIVIFLKINDNNDDGFKI
jgi:hypothetical protein